MPISTNSLMFQLSPLSSIDVGGRGSGGGSGMERERLRLMKAQFEETKRQNKIANDLAEREEKAKAAQAAAKAAEERQTREAAAAAELLKQRQAASMEFSKLAASADPEAAEAYVPYMQDLGMGVDITRRPGGLPSYRTHFDAKADAAKQAQLDSRAWETAERPLDQDVYGENPVLAPAPDISAPLVGNVIDRQELQDQRLARLSPMLEHIVQAHPTDYQDIANEAKLGIEQSGLPVDKAVQEYRQQLSGPIELAKAQLENQAKDDKLEAPGLVDRERLAVIGSKQAQSVGATYGVKDLIERRKTLAQARGVLSNKGGGDDYLAGATISRMMGEKGASTEGDVERVLGDAAVGFISKIKNRFYKEAFDGLSPRQKNALLGVLKTAEAADERRAFDFLKNVDEFTAAPDTQEDVARGARRYSGMVIPADIRARYDADKKKRAPKGAPAEQKAPVGATDPEDFEDDLLLYASEAGLDPDAIRPLVSGESGGDPKAKNARSGATGIIQFLNDEIAGSVGTSLEALKGMTAQEQLPYAIEYFKTRGIDENSKPEDYAMALAAPNFIGKPDDTVVYPKSDDPKSPWAQNEPWRPADGGDITVGSILAYYRKHGLGKAQEPAAGGASWTPKTAEERKVYEDLHGGGR